MRRQTGSGSPWEAVVGYSRAVRVGNVIEVAGTTAMNGEVLVGKGDIYAQGKHIFQKIEETLHQLGATMADVVRTRMFVTDIRQWEALGRAHREVFGDTRPVTTLVEVSRLITDDLLVEIEATAIVQ